MKEKLPKPPKSPIPERRSELPNYWVLVQAQTKMTLKKGYTKLVSASKAYEMINGKAKVLNGEITRVKVLKNEFKIATLKEYN